MTISKKLFTIFISTVLAGTAAWGAAVETGGEAPDFTLVDTYGDEHTLSDYEGQYVVLEWLNHGCPFVKRHYSTGNMPDLQKKYTDQDVVWLSVVSSAPGKQGHNDNETANRITREYGAEPSAVLVDESGDVGRLYGAKTTPHMYVIDPDGVLIYQGGIDDDPRGNKDDATNFVVEALEASMAGETVETGSAPPYGCSVKYGR